MESGWSDCLENKGFSEEEPMAPQNPNIPGLNTIACKAHKLLNSAEHVK
jgi:hypothetical protein